MFQNFLLHTFYFIKLAGSLLSAFLASHSSSFGSLIIVNPSPPGEGRRCMTNPGDITTTSALYLFHHSQLTTHHSLTLQSPLPCYKSYSLLSSLQPKYPCPVFHSQGMHPLSMSSLHR